MYLSNQRITYSVLALLLLATEIFIAVAIPATSFIRHSLGDLLVVVLVYFTLKAFINFDAKKLAIGACLFAFAIEFAQYFHVLDYLNISNRFIRIVLGTSFSFGDLQMYVLGAIAAYLIDIHVIMGKFLRRTV